jgi:hypothetical protein
MDLEQYRIANDWTYEHLARQLNLTHRAVARDYALGKRWPHPDRVDEFLKVTDGKVTLEAMHRRHANYVRSRSVNAA